MLQIPFAKNIYLMDKHFAEVILNILILTWFYVAFSKENV